MGYALRNIHDRLGNVKTKRKDVFCEERARPISGGSPPCRNSPRFALLCFLFQSFSVDFNIDLTLIILHSYVNHSQPDCHLYFLFIRLSIFSFYVQDDW